MVCHSCFETRHPQEFIRAREDRQAVPNARHVPTATEWKFINPGDVTPDKL